MGAVPFPGLKFVSLPSIRLEEGSCIEFRSGETRQLRVIEFKAGDVIQIGYVASAKKGEA